VKKLSLNLDTLQIESFTTAAERRNVGTVYGKETEAGTCWAGDSCWSCDTEDGCSGMATKGTHCGPQGTMNPAWSECMIGTMAGATCEGPSCGQVCSYVNC
jgi:hypothetical protein